MAELLNGIFFFIFIISILIRFYLLDRSIYLLERRIREVEEKCSILEDNVVK